MNRALQYQDPRPYAARFSRRAFTIIELIVCIVVLAVLAAVSLPTLAGVLSNSNDSRTRSELAAIARDSVAQYRLAGDSGWATALQTTVTELPPAENWEANDATSYGDTPSRYRDVVWKAQVSTLGLTTISPSGRYCYANATLDRTVTWCSDTLGDPFNPPGDNGNNGESSVPTDLAGVPSANQITLTWTAPTLAGISDYTIEWSTDQTTWITVAHAVSTTTNLVVDGLTNGTEYWFRVAAVAAAGPSGWSATAGPYTPTASPGTPGNLTATPADSQVTASWDAVATSNDAIISGYRLFRANSETSAYVLIYQGAATSYVDTGRTNGTTYFYKVATYGPAGESVRSAGVSATPFGAPGTPTITAASTGDGTATPVWTAPLDNGGATIADYDLQWSDDAGSSWTTVSRAASTSLTAVITGLTPGSPYLLRVRADNGTKGEWSAAYGPVVPGWSDLDAPTITSASQTGATTNTVSWDAVPNASSYQLMFSENYGYPTTITTTSTSYTHTGLHVGSTYTYQVAAINGSQLGRYSRVATITVIAAPFAPEVQVTNVTDTGATLSFTPVETTGHPTTNYVITGLPTTRSTSSESYNLSDLTPDTEYTLTVKASNSRGYSEDVTVWFRTAEAAPETEVVTGLLAQSGQDSEIPLSWQAVSGASGYRLYGAVDTNNDRRRNSNEAFVLVGTTSTTTYTDPRANGTRVFYRVTWVSSGAVESPASGTAVGVPFTTPDQVTNLSGTAGIGAVSLTWTAPSNGGSELRPYLVAYSSDAGVSWTTVSSERETTGAVITGLTPGVSYRFKVAARNAAGYGPYSDVAGPYVPTTGNGGGGGGSGSQFITLDTPTVTGESELTLSWSALAGASSYEISVQGSGGMTPLDSTSLTSYRATGLTAGQSYVFQVSAGGVTSNVAIATAINKPATPSNLAVTEGNAALTVTFIRTSSSAAPATFIDVFKNGVLVTSLEGSTATTTVSGLTGWTEYTIGLRARNAAGNSTTVTITGTPVAAPAVPTGVAATSGDDAASTVSWSASSHATLYRIYQAIDTNGNGQQDYSEQLIFIGQTDTLSYAVTGLTNGTKYYFAVAAYAPDPAGLSALSSTVSATPYTLPTITALNATTGNRQVALSWTASANGSAITDYEIYYSSNAGSSWTEFSDGITANTSATVTSLTNGTPYVFKVRAKNAKGWGAWSDPTGEVTTYAEPTAPASFVATGQVDQNSLSWSAVTNSAAAPLSGYRVYRATNTNGPFLLLTTTTATSYTDTDVAAGTTYWYELAAYGPGGESARTPKDSATPYTTPPAPTSVAGEASDSQVAVSWDAPASNGGSAITDYVIEWSTDQSTWTAVSHLPTSTTSITIDGLTNGASYYVRVAAKNAAGVGPYSTVAGPYLPLTVPTVPQDLTATGEAGAIQVTWSAVSGTTGAPFTGYRLYAASTITGPFTLVYQGSGTSYREDGLLVGTSRFYQVASYGVAGESLRSGTMWSTALANTPNTPTNVKLTPGDGSLSLAFSPAASGPSATSFTATCSDGTTSTTGTASSSPVVVAALTNGTPYSCTVIATTSGGASDPTSAVVGIPVAEITMPSGLLAWWDMNYHTGVSLNASEVTQVADRSGNGNVLSVPVGKTGPTYSGSGWQSRPAFSAPSSSYSITSSALAGLSDDATVFYAGSAGFGYGSPSGPSFYAYGSASSITPGNLYMVGSTGFTLGTPGGSSTSTRVLAGRINFEASGTTDSFYGWRNGTENRSASNVGTGLRNPSAGGAYFGAMGAFGTFTGSTGETLIFNRALTLIETWSVMQYLAAKWGTTLATPIPAAPTGLTATAGALKVNLSWSAPDASLTATAVSGYRVYRSTNAGGPFTTLVYDGSNSTATIATDTTSIAVGTTYYYKVVSWDGTSESPLADSTAASATGALDEFSGAVAASSPTYWWTMTQSSGTTSVTSEVGTNTGTAANVTFGSSSAIAARTMAGFNGTSSKVTGLTVVSMSNLTVGAVVCEATAGSAQIIYSQRTATGLSNYGGQMTLRVNSSGGVEFFINNSATSSAWVTASTAAGTVTAGGCYLIVATRSSGTLRVYVNGSLAATSSTTVSLSTQSTHVASIGYDWRDSFGSWNGRVGDVAIWSRALSATDVGTLFTASGL